MCSLPSLLSKRVGNVSSGPQPTPDILDNYTQARKSGLLIFVNGYVDNKCCRATGVPCTLLWVQAFCPTSSASKTLVQSCTTNLEHRAPPCDPSPVWALQQGWAVKPGSNRAEHTLHPGLGCRVWTAGWCVKMSQLQSPSAEQTSIVSSLERTRLPLWRHSFLFPTGSLPDTLINFPSGKMICRHRQTEWMIEFCYVPSKCK